MAWVKTFFIWGTTIVRELGIVTKRMTPFSTIESKRTSYSLSETSKPFGNRRSIRNLSPISLPRQYQSFIKALISSPSPI
jgi:hypothetical protein